VEVAEDEGIHVVGANVIFEGVGDHHRLLPPLELEGKRPTGLVVNDDDGA
jgi:hypothetical protein